MVTLHIEGEWERRLETLSGVEGMTKEQVARRLLQKGLDQELAELEARVQTVVEDARAGGPSRELSEQDWTEITSSKPEDVAAGSLAVPPGWRGPGSS